MIALISPEGVLGIVNRVIPRMMGPGGPAPDLPAFPATPSIGLAVKAGVHQVETTIVVPPAVLTEIGKYQAALHAPPAGQ